MDKENKNIAQCTFILAKAVEQYNFTHFETMAATIKLLCTQLKIMDDLKEISLVQRKKILKIIWATVREILVEKKGGNK